MWKDEFEENLSVSYGLFEDSKQNIYLIGLEGLRIYDKNGKLIDINRNIKGYGIYQFNDGYVVFNLRLKEYYEWKKNDTISSKESRSKEAEWFEVLYYDKNFNPTTSMYISGVIFCLAIVGVASYLVLVRNRKSN